uniref:RNA-directed DNA polymerase n=1 Tax=Trichuris muris TaxID=70415 RepID=A0A5S6QBK2_TRIMR
MNHVRHFEEFDVSNPAGWEEYAERLEFYMAANGIRDQQRKLAVLCSSSGPKTYSIIRSLTSPDAPSTKTFDEVMTLLRAHFVPKPSEMYRRFQFQRRSQQVGEGIAVYVAELRHLAQHCNFGDTLDSRLRDQLVCGLRDEALQKQLLVVKELTFAVALERALAAEAATVQVDEMRQPSASDIIDVKRLSGTRRSGDDSVRTDRRRRSSKPCHRCGGPHVPNTCRFKNAVCNFCKRSGHIERACWAKGQLSGSTSSSKKANRTAANRVCVEHEEYQLNATYCANNRLVPAPAERVTVKVNGVPVELEVDSGAAFTVLSEQVFEQACHGRKSRLEKFPYRLKDFQGRTVHVIGVATLSVEFGAFRGELKALIVERQRCNLLGRDWFKPLGIHLAGVNKLSHERVSGLIDEYADLFTEKINAVKCPPVVLHVDSKIPPIQMSARRVPFALKDRIAQELDRLVEQEFWSLIRICGDYKCTVNKALRNDLYQIPAVNDILATLKKGKLFAKLDLAQAYQQLQAKRLQFGIASAPGIFQKFMDTLLANVSGVVPYFDDVLIVASSTEELANILREVFTRFRRVGIRLKREKCVFASECVNFLGYRIDAEGVHPADDKVEAIHNAPSPKNKQELQAFLGLLNFYHNFLEKKAEVAEPLHRLLDKDRVWKWTREHEQAFGNLKKLISSDAVLVQYDDTLPLILTCDASPYGLGCVLAHKFPDGTEMPIAFHSRTLAPVERNYAQIDKEALAIVAGVKKFHNYIFGRHIEIRTDHKPLLGLLGKTSQTSVGMSPRMTRWCILLSAYDYSLVYRPGRDLENADALSRLPLPGPTAEVPAPLEVLLLESMPDPPIAAKQIAQMTNQDPILARVRNWLRYGWPAKVPDEFKQYWRFRNELSVHKDCVLWQSRIVIPSKLRHEVLKLFHSGHPGIVRMKGLARSYIWWPRLNQDVESLVRACVPCQEARHDPPKLSGNKWPEASKPWVRVHADFFGPFQGKVFFIAVDSFSKWLEVRLVTSVSAVAAIDVLRELFATHGLRECLVTDNGAAFKSDEFRKFVKSNHIRHLTTAPFHPETNGQAERVVQDAKNFLKKDKFGSWKLRIARLLISQHVTPCPLTNISPAELLMNRKLATCLDRLKPQDDHSTDAGVRPPGRQFAIGDLVFARSYRNANKWTSAVVVGKLGNVMYVVRTPHGLSWKRHINQLRPRRHEGSPKLKRGGM